MRALLFLLVSILAAALQATIAPSRWMGYAPVPCMLGVVVFYALMRPRNAMLQAAILIGLLGDSIGRMPLGCTAFLFAACGLVISRYRGTMAINQWTTHLFLGGCAGLVSTLGAFTILSAMGSIEMSWPWCLFRMAGGTILGAIVTVLVVSFMCRMDRLLGFAPPAAGEGA